MLALSNTSSGNLNKLLVIAATPAVIIFLSSNFVNVGNLLFNLVFSRLMGRELYGTLAFFLTAKLALLSLFAAVQIAISQKVASSNSTSWPGIAQGLSRLNRLICAALMIAWAISAAFIIFASFDGTQLLAGDALMWTLLIAALPAGASMSLLRGVAFGKMNTRKIVLSANLEMLSRLFGALVAWFLGWGVEGVVGAIAISIVVGWIVLLDLLPRKAASVPVRSLTRSIAVLAFPFAILQLSQTLALDGEILVAKYTLRAEDSGHVAALSLFQRIQFFACFGLASVLIPGVASAIANNEPLGPAIWPIAALFTVASSICISSAVFAPTVLIRTLVGSEFEGASAGLILAVVSAACVTFSYLAVSFLLTLGNRSGLVAIASAAGLQITLMALISPTTFVQLLTIKLACQATAAILVLAITRSHARNACGAFTSSNIQKG